MIMNENDVQNSNIPLGFVKTEIDTKVDDFISVLEDEIKAEQLSEPVSADGDATNVAAEAGVTGTEQPAVKEAPAVTPTPEPVDAVVAREVAFKTREDALAAREKQLEGIEAKFKELEARQVPGELTEAIRTVPSNTLRAMGIDPDHLVRVILAEKMGEKAPPELRSTLKDMERDREMKALRNRVEGFERAQSAQAYVAKVETGAREYVAKIGDNASTPTLAKVAKADPDRAHREIMDEIRADARDRMNKDPNGQALPYDEAAKRVEARWAPIAKVLSPASMTPAPKQEDKPTATGTSTPKTTPTTLKKPLAPWLTANNSDVEKAGLMEAMAEYKKVEGAIRK